jgi:beta-alanine--pyruvate transaminase
MNKPEAPLAAADQTAAHWEPTPNNLESFWMPFTPNRAFKARPRLISRAQDMHYYDISGRAILDGSAGLWCCNAGHCRPRIVEAIQRQASELDFAPTFQFGHPKVFELAGRLAAMAPGNLDHAFFTNSGSEATDTALKIALAYHRVRGDASRTRLIGRERGYHGVGFGGISVGGMVANRKWFGAMLPGVDHLPHTYNRDEQAFTKGQPEWGGHLADELERLVQLHDASTIAAVIVEPMSGSTGVLPPPLGLSAAPARDLRHPRHPAHLRRGDHRLRPPRPCLRRGTLRRRPRHDLLRQGRHVGHRPDGRRARRQAHLRRLHERAGARHRAVPRLYLYRPSDGRRGRPCHARDLPRRGAVRARPQAGGRVGRRGDGAEGPPLVADIRTIGITVGIDLVPVPGAPGKRAYDVMESGFHDHGLMVRISGDTLEFSPPLIISESQIDEMFSDRLPKMLAAANG